MLQTRIIPCLQIINNSLVKTIKFNHYNYIGDYINTVRTFNELEVDELCFLDIRASKENRNVNLEVLAKIADECFMPLSYGGGIKDFETAAKVLSIGFEKVILNTSIPQNVHLITQISTHFGAQATVGSIDVKRNIWGKHQVFINSGTEKLNKPVVDYAKELEQMGVGEILLTSIDRDGTWSGFDIDITRKVADAVRIPVIANGGAGNLDHIAEVVKKGGASAVALGSMVVYQKKDMGVLINFPNKYDLEKKLLF